MERDVGINIDISEIWTALLDVVAQGLGVDTETFLDVILDGLQLALQLRVRHVCLELAGKCSLDGILGPGGLSVKD
ncbi:hypothetical protein [Streptomyces antarcticus]|uniref:hypothetical protein n=1 Tax=Streptomyces antarcticus TaxID=2996458 RepID=UPI0022AFD150|nr:hypothetical protein [Streptomyces sp. H34-S5]MCZ4084405.1 hypothetical protein [Streptomyces sp. H34-S5]